MKKIVAITTLVAKNQKRKKQKKIIEKNKKNEASETLRNSARYNSITY